MIAHALSLLLGSPFAAVQDSSLESRIFALLDNHRAPEARILLGKSKVQDARLRGLICHGSYQADSTLAILGPLQRAGSRDPRVLLALADAFLWKKDFRNAEMLLESCPAKESVPYLKTSASLLESTRRIEEAIAMWDRVIARDPLPWEAMERKAIALGWLKRFGPSIELLDRIIAAPPVSAPQRLRARTKRAETLAWMKEFDKALDEIGRIKATHPDHVPGLLLEGSIREWQGRFVEAKSIYSTILQTTPHQSEALARMENLEWVK